MAKTEIILNQEGFCWCVLCSSRLNNALFQLRLVQGKQLSNELFQTHTRVIPKEKYLPLAVVCEARWIASPSIKLCASV